MKKLMIVMGLFGVVLFGLDLQKVGPVATINSEASLQDVKVLKFSATKPAQITINVPVDLDEVPVGASVDPSYQAQFPDSATTGEIGLRCYLSDADDTPIGTSEYISVTPGQYTVKVSFNDLPLQILAKVNKYSCYIFLYATHTTGYGFAPHAFSNVIEIDNSKVIGNIE